MFFLNNLALTSDFPKTPLLDNPAVITYSPLPFIWVFWMSKSPFWLVNKSPSVYSPHLTACNFLLSEAFIFPGSHPPKIRSLKVLLLPKQDNH